MQEDSYMHCSHFVPGLLVCTDFPTDKEAKVWSKVAPFGTGVDTHTLEKVAPWSVISGSFAVCISPLNLDTAGNNV